MEATQRIGFRIGRVSPTPTMDVYFHAAKTHNRELLGQLLENEPPGNVKMSNEALQEAVKLGDMNSVRFFIENGIQLKEEARSSAIEIAQNKGFDDVAELLLRQEFYLRAVDILGMLDSEHIDTSNRSTMLRIVRELAQDIACRTLIFAPALTASVAISLLKVGLCQELSQRFALEYFIKYNRKDISLIFLSNPNEGPKLEDHMFVHIGPINVPETLLLGKNTNLRYCQLSPKKANQEFAEFLSNNKNGICADPLLHCAGNVDGGLAPLLEYCERHNLTHVICVSSYHNTPGIVENAPTIKNNAIAVAEKIKSQLGIAETLVRGLQKKPQK